MEPEKSLPSHVLNIKDLSQVLLLTLAMFVASILFGALMMFIAGPQWALLAEALLIVPAILVVRQRHMPFKLSFRFNAVSWPTLFYSFLIIFPVLVLGDEMDRLLNIVFPLPNWFDVRELLAIRSLSDGVLIVGNGVIIAALAEEMLFRGMIQQTFEFHRDTATAIVISAILFAILHFNPWWMIQITILGLVLGYMAWKSASIWPTVLLHGINNLLSIISANTAEAKLSWYASAVHVHWYWLVLAGLVVIPAFRGFNHACEKMHARQEREIQQGGFCEK